jgi:serine/threonine protein kinase
MSRADPQLAAPQIPDFELLRRIGRGSYGEVWIARSVTGALRAIKIVHRERFDSARPYEREFQGIQKYEAVSRLAEGLVHLLHVSRGDEFFYYVMELADDASGTTTASGTAELAPPILSEDPASKSIGPETAALPLPRELPHPPGDLPPELPRPVAAPARDATPRATTRTGAPGRSMDPGQYRPRTLAGEIKQRGRLPFAECVRIALTLARGLEHLHHSGLIHRDLKPSNIIFVQGAPKLADIGLVTEADEPRSLVGTEGYLPPDGGGTPQADLYSLGKVLYEISTGMDRQDFPVMPVDFGHLPDRQSILELSEVFEKACEALPADRYANAAEMRAELELLAAGQSVIRRHRQSRWLRRLARVGLIAILASGLVALGWWWPRESTGRSVSAVAQANHEWQAGWRLLEQRTPEGLRSAIDRFDAAVRLDPGFALPLAGRAEAFALLASYQAGDPTQAWSQAKESAEAALRLLPSLASPHFTLGLVAKNHEFAWHKAEHYFQAGLALDPQHAHGHQWYSSLLGALGRSTGAVAMARRAVELDPTSRSANANLGIQLHFARQYEAAVMQYRRTLALAPDFTSARLYLSRLYLATDRLHQGLIERLLALPPTPEGQAERRRLDGKRMTLGAGGFWREWLATVETNQSTSAFSRAEAYLQLGNIDATVAALREAVIRRELNVLYLAVDPLFDPVRSHPLFLAALDQLQLPRDAARAAIIQAELALTDIDRAAGLSPEEKAAGFRPIFDGRSLQGWRSDQTNWIVLEGALQMVGTSGARPSPLRYITQTVPDNFELRFEWKVDPGGDSGVNYRPGLVQYQVIDNGIVPRKADRYQHIAGALYACIGHQSVDDTLPVGSWNVARIVCYDTTIEHHLNGRMQFRFKYTIPGLSNLVASLEREEMRRIRTTFGNIRARGGYLSLQDEGLPGAAFRRLRWRRLE